MMPEGPLHSEPLRCILAVYYAIWWHQVVPALPPGVSGHAVTVSGAL